MGWYTHGTTDEDIESARKESKNRSVGRFFLKAGESRRVIMLDDKDFAFWEHHVKINDKWGNFFTCIKGVDPKNPVCPLCVSKASRSYTGFITVLDATGWTNDKNEKVLYTRQLFPMTLKTLERFKLKRHRKT
jgi:hypothetical protein